MERATRSRRIGSLAAVAVGAVLVAGCQGTAVSAPKAPGSGTPQQTAPPSAAPPSTAPLNPSGNSGNSGVSGEKAPLNGLLDMGIQTPYQTGQPFPVTDPSFLDAYAGDFSGIVVNESWSQLEPSPGVENWAPLDQSLAAVAAWNASHPATPLGVKLRIFAGYSAPAWVVSQSGPTVTVQTKGGTKVLGEWWTTPFRQAWSAFQHALAERYDPNPLVRAVSVSSCSSSTGEPFVVSGAVSSQRALAAAGWTPQLQEACLQGALSDYSGWTHTQITFAINPLATRSGPDVAFMDQIMQACAGSHAAGGSECVVGNNDLSATAPSGNVGPSYAEIAAVKPTYATGSGVYFQTGGPAVDCATMSVATTYHATSVELWPPNGRYSGFSAVPTSTLKSWNQTLISGGTVTC